MKPFIIYKEKHNNKTEYFILQRGFPHFLGQIVTAPISGAIINSPISKHNLWVTFRGTIRGNMIPNYKDIKDEINNTFTEMANFYYLEKIKPNENSYQKFRINDTSSKK